MDYLEKYMRRCLELAQKGSGSVAPNPMVGAVLVYEDELIGEGWHQQFGAAHAEVNCINSVVAENKDLIAKSTMYVSLEPCAHYGKTPPCADLIINCKIPKVVIGCRDSFSEVSGRGMEKLRSAGIEVVVGVLEKQCRLLNKRFFTFHEKARAYIILKWAQSADGFIAPAAGTRTQLSNESSRKLVHKMRRQEGAVLIGFQTALSDNPQLNNRIGLHQDQQPLRVVFDFENQLPGDLNIFDHSQRTVVFNWHTERCEGNNQWIKINPNQDALAQVLARLKDVQSIIVEGGTKTLNLFIDSGIWDEALIFKAPVFLGNGIAAPLLTNSTGLESFNLANDIVSLQAHERNSFYL